MTLRDLRSLYLRHVPVSSRHYNADDGAKWWHAHELGHLLTVEPDSIGWSMFGLDDANDPHGQNVHDRLCRELAAMSVSRRLLKACGREDIAQLEIEETDSVTLRYLDEPKARRRVDAILREHSCLRIPRTRDALAAKLERIHVNP